MLEITVPAVELYDEKNNMFINLEERTIHLEHSLVSVSKWEAKYCKPFISKTDKTDEEVVDYIKMMTLTQDVEPDVYQRLTKANYEAIENYINAPMTATTFRESKGSGKKSNETVTNEVIYYWMSSLGIEKAYEEWHLNRLLTFIRVCNEMNAPKKKMSKKDTVNQYAALNRARRQKLNSKG